MYLRKYFWTIYASRDGSEKGEGYTASEKGSCKKDFPIKYIVTVQDNIAITFK